MNSNTIIVRLVRRIVLACLALAVCLTAARAGAAPAPAASSGPDFAAIDSYVESQMRDLRIPGLALGIVQGDQIVHLKGFGVADPSGRAVTPQTPFHIVSISKSFTALAVMQLVEAGKVELDAPIQHYLPWFRLADPDAAARITVRQLMTQTSGFSRASENVFLGGSDTSADALERRVRALSTHQLNRPVGSTYEYTAVNAWVLGLLVQTVSGQSFEDYVQQHIFAPLDMRNTYLSPIEARTHGMAVGHRFWFGQPVAFATPYQRAEAPATWVIASAEDMAHFLSAELNGGRYGNASILSPEGIAAMQQAVVPQGNHDMYWGMGWDVGQLNGIPAVWRWGDGPNVHAKVVLIPAGKWGIVVMENAETFAAKATGDRRIDQTAEGVASLLLGRQPPAPNGSGGTLLVFYGLVLGPALLQLIAMIWALASLRRWWANPARRPHGRRGIVRHVVAPLVLHGALALVFLVGVPPIFNLSWTAILLVLPDIGSVALASGILALVWSILGAILAFRVLRQPGMPHPAGAPVNA